MNKQKLLRYAHIFSIVALLTVPMIALTQTTSSNDPLGLGQVNKTKTNLPDWGITPGSGSGSSVTNVIVTVIKLLLGLAGAVAVLFVIIGGFQYVTSAGSPEGAKKGKTTLVNAIIGIIIIVLSYVIITVISNLVSSGGSVGGTIPGGGGIPGRP